jgi:hypothetical protein
LTQSATLERMVGDDQRPYAYPAVVHAHHYHVRQHETGGVVGEFEPRTHFHIYEHDHAPQARAMSARPRPRFAKWR